MTAYQSLYCSYQFVYLGGSVLLDYLCCLGDEICEFAYTAYRCSYPSRR
ncbi:hypothetical protein CO2235_U770025 [Cupriavidus oxalaticus]|uniref:Uncharacterized protein n=1 Tax=Cupriavidus oxalaticus TaxID=96344 RepID=A0A375FTF6_9BURK|nr:hypothetical protein CO2235_U770025 [Cupriavidus oxalaticus]